MSGELGKQGRKEDGEDLEWKGLEPETEKGRAWLEVDDFHQGKREKNARGLERARPGVKKKLRRAETGVWPSFREAAGRGQPFKSHGRERKALYKQAQGARAWGSGRGEGKGEMPFQGRVISLIWVTQRMKGTNPGNGGKGTRGEL